MHVEKCDRCGKELEREQIVRVSDRGVFSQYSFCNECGAPVLVFLADLALVNKGKRV